MSRSVDRGGAGKSAGSPSAGTLRFGGAAGFGGTSSPRPFATSVASVASICARWPTIRSRIGGRLTLPELEAERLDEVLLLGLRLALEEHPRLAVVVEEARAARADLRALERLRVGDVAAGGRGRLRGQVVAERVRLVAHAAGIDLLAHEPVALVVVRRGDRPVDRDLVEVRAAEPDQLRVGVREQPALQQRVVA